MDFRDTPAEAAFREEARAFLQKEAPKPEPGGEVSIDYTFDLDQIRQHEAWFRKLAARGWLAPHWPKEYGGAGLTVMQQMVLNEEIALARAPRPMHLLIGLAVAGPTIIVLGTEEQKKFYLPRILSGDDIWCQGYSEPNAGSDLASLQTRAVADGDHYLVNGHKIWTSFAHEARWMILLARTDPGAPKHQGITCFVLDMKSAGVSVQPLVNMGGTHEFNQIFFENVRVPRENVIGQENRGWYAAVKSLDFERSSLGSAVGLRQMIEDLARFAREHAHDGRSTLAYNEGLRYELADRYIEAEVARVLSYRVASILARGEIPNYEASINKIFTMELNQRVAGTGMKVLGLYGQLDESSRWAPLAGRIRYMYLRSTANTIEGGTSEIQRNVVAQRGLGLPRE